MAKWRCTVCNYVVEAEEPPERCPVCGADRSKFVRVDGEAAGGDGEADAGEQAQAVAVAAAGETGAARPETGEAVEPGAGAERPAALRRLIVKNRIHPISAHVPNGLLPAAVLLLFLGLLFSHAGFRQAAYYNLVLVVVAMPVVAVAGYCDWQARFGGVYTPLIVTKIVCAVVVFAVGLILLIWRWSAADPGWPFFLLHLVMLGAAGVAGYLGGKLVFGGGNDGGGS